MWISHRHTSMWHSMKTISNCKARCTCMTLRSGVRYRARQVDVEGVQRMWIGANALAGEASRPHHKEAVKKQLRAMSMTYDDLIPNIETSSFICSWCFFPQFWCVARFRCAPARTEGRYCKGRAVPNRVLCCLLLICLNNPSPHAWPLPSDIGA